MDLHDLFDNVIDQETFLIFAKALQEDKEDEDQKEQESPSNPYGRGHNGWENDTIAGFLESATAYFEKTDFIEKQVGDNPWKKFALFLFAGKFYE